VSTHSLKLSRRGFCLCCLGATTFAATGGWLTPSQVFAEARNVVDSMRADAANAPIAVHKLRGNVAALVGSGGNIAVLAGSEGKILVDAGITASRPRITEALNSLGRQPISHLINTHWHFDHADGNEWLNGEGAVILAHENTRKHLSEATRVEDWDFNFPAAPTAAIPRETFAFDRKIDLGGNAVELRHFGPAHTDGDAVVILSEANVLHAGDIYWNRRLPLHRLLDGRKHRRDDPRSRSDPQDRSGRYHRRPGSRGAREQPSGACGVPRHAPRRPRTGVGTQTAGSDDRRDGRGKADGRVRRQMGPVRRRTGHFHQARLRRGLSPGVDELSNPFSRLLPRCLMMTSRP
jgi:glyoxylase-like metal-dependent hydrolase (beta-lactamase superfamily II)